MYLDNFFFFFGFHSNISLTCPRLSWEFNWGLSVVDELHIPHVLIRVKYHQNLLHLPLQHIIWPKHRIPHPIVWNWQLQVSNEIILGKPYFFPTYPNLRKIIWCPILWPCKNTFHNKFLSLFYWNFFFTYSAKARSLSVMDTLP